MYAWLCTVIQTGAAADATVAALSVTASKPKQSSKIKSKPKPKAAVKTAKSAKGSKSVRNAASEHAVIDIADIDGDNGDIDMDVNSSESTSSPR